MTETHDSALAKSRETGKPRLTVHGFRYSVYTRTAMHFPSPLVPGTLIRRYKRFLFDARLDDGTAITGSCPNTGSMRGLTSPGSHIWMSQHDSPTRRYRHCLEIVEAGGTMVGINTGLPNRIAEEAVRSGLVADLDGYATLKREQRYGANSRIDMLLSDDERGLCFVEVKNVHMSREKGLAEFPDSVTTRGAKHLDELSAMVRSGHRAVMLYIIQRADIEAFRLCRDLDPRYAENFDRATRLGVEAYAVRCDITSDAILPACLVPIDEPGVAQAGAAAPTRQRI